MRAASELLTDNIDKLHMMADTLLQYETIDAHQIDDIMAGREPGPPADWTKSVRRFDAAAAAPRAMPARRKVGEPASAES